MLRTLVLAALCLKVYAQPTTATAVATTQSAASSGITLKECLDEEEKYGVDAFDCEDVLAICQTLFLGGSETAPSLGANTERPKNCWTTDGTTTNNTIVKDATQSCPKFCGLCCKTAKYDCEDDRQFDCDKVKKANQCKDPWKSQLNLVDKCPKTCGLCEEKNGDCQDKEPNCDADQCKHIDFREAMKVNCKRTCGFCDEETTIPAQTTAPAQQTTVQGKTEPTTTCGNDERCPKWLQNGFCTNPLYPDDYKIRYCGKVCGRC